jgi:hypothetical protein
MSDVRHWKGGFTHRKRPTGDNASMRVRVRDAVLGKAGGPMSSGAPSEDASRASQSGKPA